MLEKIYIDNYKCLTNFEWRLESFTTLLGENGTGKSSIFECVRILRDLISGKKIAEVIAVDTLTKWQKKDTQTFAIDVSAKDGMFSYALEIEFTKSRDKVRVMSEKLLLDDHLLFEMKTTGKNCEVQLFRDDYSTGPKYPFSWDQSGLSTIQERNDNKKLSSFKQYMESIVFLKINPFAIKAESFEEATKLTDDATNFVDWYRYSCQEYTKETSDFFTTLSKIFSGSMKVNLKLEKTGLTGKRLKIAGDNNTVFDFSEISEGQKALLILYALLHLRGTQPMALLLDEPDNFVSIREIQPLLMRLNDLTEDGHLQVLLISHNSEVINLLGASNGWLAYRTFDSPVRIKKLSDEISASTIPLSEQLARGWME